MKHKALFLLLALATVLTALLGQSLRVVELLPEDAALLRRSKAALDKAQADYDAADKYVKQKYAPALKACNEKGDCATDNVQYSEDYRFAVRSSGAMTATGDVVASGFGGCPSCSFEAAPPPPGAVH